MTATADKPASFLRSTDPATKIKGMPPNFGEDILPHVVTFRGILSTIAKVYRSSDEAIRDSRESARFMRNDPTIMECLEQRQRSTALLNWHLEAEDQKDSRQKELCEHLKAIIETTPRFMQYRENLLHALWYGKYGVQHRYRWKKVRGQMRVCVDRWLPVNGDKIVFRFDDGTGMYDPDQVGIRVGAGFTSSNDVAKKWSENRRNKVEPTDFGMAYFLEPWEKRMLAIHKHMIEDGDYDEPRSAEKIHGLGIRSRIYWTWYQKQESLAWLMEFLERSAFGFEIWYYPWGDNQAKEKVEKAAKERIGQGRNIVFMPRPMDDSGGMAYGVDKIEANMAGAEVLKGIIREYFGHQIKRYILGQTLTTEADATGLGSDLASVHLDTYMQIIQYDATNLEETLTTELVEPLKAFNFPRFRDVPVRFRIDTEAADVEGKLSAWERAWTMGVKLRSQDVMDLIGASKPDSDEDILLNPQVESARQQMRQQQQQSQVAMVQGGLGGNSPSGAANLPSGGVEDAKNQQTTTENQPVGSESLPVGEDDLPEGNADPSQFDPDQLERGIAHEMEQTDDPEMALKIAMDNLAEHPDYYETLERMNEDDSETEVQAYSADSFRGSLNDNLEQTTADEYVERVAKAASKTDTAPSDKQKATGNYRKGKCRIHGLEIAIENPAGSVRRGQSSSGESWSITMPAHYGYIKQTESEADGDHVDVFLGPDLDSEAVFIIDQLTPAGRFDEHKCMIGWKSAEEATAAYWQAYSTDYKGKVGAVVAMTMPQFKHWLKHGDTGHRAADQVERYRKLSDFRETDHPRGQPDNPGEFAPKPGGQGGGEKHTATATAAPGDRQPDPKKEQSQTELAKPANPLHSAGGKKKVHAATASTTSSGVKHEVRIVGGEVWYRNSADNNARWKQLPSKTAEWFQKNVRESADRAFEKKRQREEELEIRIVRQQVAEEKIIAGLEYGPIKGNALRRRLKIDLNTFVDAYFGLADAGKISQDPRDGTIYLGANYPNLPLESKKRKTKNDDWKEDLKRFASQIKVVAPKKTPEQIAAEKEAKENKEAERVANEKATRTEERRGRKNEKQERLNEVAEAHDISADDLLEATKFVLDSQLEEFNKRENAKNSARGMTGLTQNDVRRVENSGRDYSTIKTHPIRFDKAAVTLARDHPGVIGDPDDGSDNLSAGLWELLREGKLESPTLYDPEILDEAASYVVLGKQGGKSSIEEEPIPFARPGQVERYRKYADWKQQRQKQVQYVASLASEYFAEHYAKHKPARDQKSFTWTEEDEQKHPRDGDGKFAGKDSAVGNKLPKDLRPAGWKGKTKVYDTIGKLVSDVMSSSPGECPPGKRQVVVGSINKELSSKIHSLTNGTVNVDGYNCTLDDSSIRHIIRGHGTAGKRISGDQIAIEPEHFNLLPDVIDSPDDIKDEGENKRGLKVIRLEKNFGQYVVYVTEVRTGNRELATVSMRMYKTKPNREKYAAIEPTVSTSKTTDHEGPRLMLSTEASTEIIGHPSSEVKRENYSVVAEATAAPQLELAKKFATAFSKAGW